MSSQSIDSFLFSSLENVIAKWFQTEIVVRMEHSIWRGLLTRGYKTRSLWSCIDSTQVRKWIFRGGHTYGNKNKKVIVMDTVVRCPLKTSLYYRDNAARFSSLRLLSFELLLSPSLFFLPFSRALFLLFAFISLQLLFFEGIK